MYLKFGREFLDCDFDFLRESFTLFDGRLDDLTCKIEDLGDDEERLLVFDDVEYVTGMGFVACQRYLTSTLSQSGLDKEVALTIGPRHIGGEPIARLLNSCANYWKHVDEWDLEARIERDASGLSERQRTTMRCIETVTQWSDYTCANLLYELTGPNARFKALLPVLESWRGDIDSARVA